MARTYAATGTHTRRRNDIAIKKKSAEKPGCIVVEAEYTFNSFRFPRILLAAIGLLHPAFEEEIEHQSLYVDDGQDHQLHDH
jgi:hypothetical protein